jgi:hypothetical protein
MNKVLNNKWTKGKAQFINHTPPTAYANFNGIYSIYGAIDKSIGTEVILYIRDETDFIYDVADLRPFELFLKTGLLNTEFGPLLFLLFYIPDPADNTKAYAIYDIHLNPLEPEHLSMFYDLSRQTHWHLFLIDGENEQAGFFEFENNYGLYQDLQTAEETCKELIPIDFMKAKEIFINTYSLEDLYAL